MVINVITTRKVFVVVEVCDICGKTFKNTVAKDDVTCIQDIYNDPSDSVCSSECYETIEGVDELGRGLAQFVSE